MEARISLSSISSSMWTQASVWSAQRMRYDDSGMIHSTTTLIIIMRVILFFFFLFFLTPPPRKGRRSGREKGKKVEWKEHSICEVVVETAAAACRRNSMVRNVC